MLNSFSVPSAQYYDALSAFKIFPQMLSWVKRKVWFLTFQSKGKLYRQLIYNLYLKKKKKSFDPDHCLEVILSSKVNSTELLTYLTYPTYSDIISLFLMWFFFVFFFIIFISFLFFKSVNLLVQGTYYINRATMSQTLLLSQILQHHITA